MALLLRPRDGMPASIDLAGIGPDALAPLGPDAILRMEIVADGRPAELGDCFTIEGDAADGQLLCEGDFSRVDGVGAGMAAGRMQVRGTVGRRAGAGMQGGLLEIVGGAGDWLAVGMAGGTLRVEGDAGDDAAAAPPGGAVGMTAGTVLVGGRVGQRAGARMRRGILAVGGDCGAAAGLELRAGTVVVCGRLGPDAGVGMRRGSIVAAGPATAPGAWFLPGATWEPPVLRLLGRTLAAARFPPAAAAGPAFLDGRWRQWHGDGVTAARGEFFSRESR